MAAVVAMATGDVEVMLEAAVPAVKGSGEGGTFHLNVRPVPAGSRDGGSKVRWFT